MEKKNSNPTADKSAKKISNPTQAIVFGKNKIDVVDLKAQSNPLASKAVKSNPKSETKTPALDPEKEKAINEAHKAVVEAEKTFAEAKTKLAEAKANLKKLTGGKSKEEKGPGVISTIFSLVKDSGKTGISKQAILDKLIEMFPDRAQEGMEKTIGVQLPGRMSKERKVKIVKLESGAFTISQ